MARRCKCQVTGEWGTVSTFYKVPYKNRNLYYKDEETYLNYKAEMKIKQDINRFVAFEVLNYDSNQYLPPYFLKRINDLGKNYPFEVILETFKNNADTLKYWMSQEDKFENESGRLNYIMAIINSKINDEYEKWRARERQAQIEENIEVNVDLLDVELTNKKSDSGISDFL